MLIAEGTETQKITFPSEEAEKDRGQWENLRFGTAKSSASRVSHCVIEAGGNMGWFGSVSGLIYCANGATLEVSNCTLTKSNSDGTHSADGSSVTAVTSSSITDVWGYGMVLHNCSPVLTDNTISGCGTP